MCGENFGSNTVVCACIGVPFYVYFALTWMAIYRHHVDPIYLWVLYCTRGTYLLHIYLCLVPLKVACLRIAVVPIEDPPFHVNSLFGTIYFYAFFHLFPALLSYIVEGFLSGLVGVVIIIFFFGLLIHLNTSLHSSVIKQLCHLFHSINSFNHCCWKFYALI